MNGLGNRETKEKGKFCQKDIEYNLGLTHPTVSSVLNRMEANGLIRTQTLAADHRYKRILLTEKAENLSGPVSAKYRAVKERLFSGVSPAQRELMNVTMKMMLKNVQE